MTPRERILDLARSCAGQMGPEPWAREAGFRLGPNDRPSWCGLFVRSIWRRAGLRVPDWQMGQGNVTYLRKLGPGERAQPGDLGYVLQHGHQAIVVSDDGSEVISIDGNVFDRVVVDRRRRRTDYAAFYSIEPLLTGEGKDEPTTPAPAPGTVVPRVLGVAPVRGAEARRVQAELIRRGAAITADGVAGPTTVQALVSWAWQELARD